MHKLLTVIAVEKKRPLKTTGSRILGKAQNRDRKEYRCIKILLMRNLQKESKVKEINRKLYWHMGIWSQIISGWNNGNIYFIETADQLQGQLRVYRCQGRKLWTRERNVSVILKKKKKMNKQLKTTNVGSWRSEISCSMFS